MRIVSGTHKGRIITPPKGFKARPTTDFAKENIFNVLNNLYDFDGLSVLDLFSGTGSISYEFASRGATAVMAVEMDPLHHRFIQRSVDELGLKQIRVIKSNVFVFMKSMKCSYDIIFADPPYDLDGIDTIPDIIFANKLLGEDGLLILEHGKENDFSKHPHFMQCKHYGSVNFSLFQNINEE